MLKVELLCGVIAAMSLAGAKFDKPAQVESKSCDTKFIIELEDDIDNISTDEAIKQQNSVFNKIRNTVNKNATQDHNFTLLNNAVVVSANKEDLNSIKNIPGVKYVTEEGTHIVKKENTGFISLDVKRDSGTGADESNASAVTMKKPANTNEGEGTLIAVLDNEFYLRGEHVEDGVTKPAYNHETFTALPDGTKERLTYSAVRNLKSTNAYKDGNSLPGGIVTGMGKEGSLYFNNKVPFYYDYAGDSYDGGSKSEGSDFNVESTVDLHGSHVASIAAGNADTYKGIAPKAQLCLMKVFTDVHKTPASDAAKMGEYGSFSEIGFIKALEDCITIGVDAINVSIGSDLADFEEGTISQRTLQKITDAGILSAISAGNAGKMSYAFTGGYANWTREIVETGIMGSFANNASTMTIASGQPVRTFYENSLSINGNVVPYEDQIVNRDGQTADYPDNEHRLVELINGGIVDIEDDNFEPTAQEQETEIPYIYVKGFGEEKDYKNLDVSNKIVVVNRGKCNFSDKYENANNHGAKALIIINNDPTEQDFTFRCDFGDSAKSIKFPCAVALFKDKPVFEANPTGVFKIKRKTESENALARTISDFSTDGATYDLDLKPEITTPGTNIKGAVWPQNKLEKKDPYRAYEYFNGTSMAAPNYEGAIALVLSKVAGELSNITSATSLKTIANARKSIDMKMMSTAIPMHDSEVNDEDGKKTITSPRMQGAGMVNLEGAYNTDIYLEGKDVDGTKLNKAKILLRNNDDIAKGKVKLDFIAHNTSNTTKTYKVSYSVMRPAKALSNKVLSSDYGKPVEIDNVKNIPGWEFYSPEEEKVIKADGTASYKDTFKVTKDIEYYRTAEEYANETPLGVIKEGMYYCSSKITNSSEGIVWEEVPKSVYQSIKDVEIAKVDCGTITVEPGDKEISLTPYELTTAQKDTIAELYEAGTYIEGYVSMEDQATGGIDLSIPYLGFYSLSDRIEGASYSSAPVVEPFSFEKDPSKFYGSDLVNDVAKSLLGKDNADMGSLMVTGYAKNIESINTEPILANDNNITGIAGFHEVATRPDPYTSDRLENPGENIYLGNPQKSNTLIIQQFVYRSVKDNYFTITNKETGEEVYRSAMEDMLFGDTEGKYALYKSHVDGSYLGGGYVAHRAFAMVPLYDLASREPFASGEYELKFNYQLVATDEWVSKTYKLHIDSESPDIKSIYKLTKDGKEYVHVSYDDLRCAYAVIGSTKVDVKYDEAKHEYYSEFEKDIMDAASSSTTATTYSQSRVFIKVVDFARGETTAICHMADDYKSFVIAQGNEFTVNHDFKFENGEAEFIVLDENGVEQTYNIANDVKIIKGTTTVAVKPTETEDKKEGFFEKIIRMIKEFFEKIFAPIRGIFGK